MLVKGGPLEVDQSAMTGDSAASKKYIPMNWNSKQDPFLFAESMVMEGDG